MKRILFCLMAMVAIVGCTEAYDDSDIRTEINDLKGRVTALEKMCKEMNTNIASLQTIVGALQTNDYITNVSPIVQNGKTIGYTISFAKAQPITIYHGTDGKDGQDGQDGADGEDGKDSSYVPQIGVKQDVDGIYYWTLDGEWLLDENGNKVKAVGTDGKDGENGKDGVDGEDGKDGKDGVDGEDGQDGADGKDGITPQLKIENDYWYISYDNGQTWTMLGKATGEDGQDGADGKDGQDGTNGADGKDGESFFQSVDTSNDDYVIFTLFDGTQIQLPTWYAFEQLRTLCNQMNTNITALQNIVAALQNNDYITSCTPLMEDGVQVGYTITFAKSDPIVIYHGKNGADGQPGADGEDGTDGATPIIGVKQDADGNYYWTLNGEWLLDENGDKVKAVGTDGEDGENGQDGTNGANGKDGVTPQFKIEDQYWYISYDNGQTWTMLGKATGEDGADGKDGQDGTDGTNGADGKDGESFFQSVTQDEHNVYFTLADGTVITVPKGTSLNITFAESDLVVMSPNSTREISYTVTSATETVTVEVTSSADVKAKVIADDDSGLMGKIRITTGATIDEYSKVIVFVSNDEKVIMRSITFEEAGLVVEENTTKSVAAAGGNVTLEFLSNVSYDVVIPEDAQSWISVVPATRAMEKHTVVLELEPNDGELRSADVIVKSTEGNLSLTYTIEQDPSLDYQLALEREALIAIYNALDGDNWTNNTNWCSDKPVGAWAGVYTNGQNVTGLQIEGRVTANSPKGIFPIEAQNLQHLTYLHFVCTNIDSFAEGLSFNNIEEVYFRDNVFLHLTELAPIYKGGNLKSFIVGFNDNDLYGISDAYLTPLPIPNELLDNKELQTLNLWACNLAGEIPEKLWDLNHLENLQLYNKWETYFYGAISPSIANLHNLKDLWLFNLNLSGGIPEELYALTQLEYLAIDCCNIGGQLSSNIQNLKNLRFLNLRDCNLDGNLPEELAILMDGDLEYCMLTCNKLTGDIPDKIKNHSKWAKIWTSVVSENQFNLTIDDVPAPVFDTNDVWGNRIVSDEVYKKNSYTIIYGFDIAMFPYISNAVYSCHEMHKLYNAYKQYGVDVIMFDGSGYGGPGTKTEAMKKFLTDNNLPWSAIMSDPFGMTPIPYIVIVDSMGKVAYTTILTNPLFDDVKAFFEEKFPNAYYTSTDYSQDGVVTTLQTATKGAGIDVVLMGDAYSDRQIADGTYKTDMEYIYNNLFAKEPYKSFKDHFNVHYVKVVSATEGYDYGNTALSGYFGNGTQVGGNDSAVFNYALNAISEEEMDEALLIVAMNSNNYAGTCYMYYPQTSLGYGNGVSVAYFPKGGDQTTFAQLLHHEACGHGFAKLADEYAYESMGAVPNDYVSQIQTQQTDWGWWKNVDFTSDVTAVRWAKFISDSRYANEKLGAYEGAMTYWSGVWRPTENSIMRHNTGGFNAPSREAIYYRIHRLAYGDEWTYDYETFVKYDEINRTTTTTTQSVPMIYKPTAPPVVMQKNWRDELR